MYILLRQAGCDQLERNRIQKLAKCGPGQFPAAKVLILTTRLQNGPGNIVDWPRYSQEC
jgi:hypothetical protein